MPLLGIEPWTWGTKAMYGVSAPRLSLVSLRVIDCVYLESLSDVRNWSLNSLVQSDMSYLPML